MIVTMIKRTNRGLVNFGFIEYLCNLVMIKKLAKTIKNINNI